VTRSRSIRASHVERARIVLAVADGKGTSGVALAVGVSRPRRAATAAAGSDAGSWLNLVEVFVGITTKQAIRRGSFDSVKEFVAAIRTFIECWNERCHPFIWTRTADQILPHATGKPHSDAGH
jgi:hypothetical protein